jgi:hypothetical protein
VIETGRKLRPDTNVHGHDEVIPQLVLAQNWLHAERFSGQPRPAAPIPSCATGSARWRPEAYRARGSVKDAASALGLHRHTVLYRLDKLKELLGGDLDVPANRLRLQLALDLQKLL